MTGCGRKSLLELREWSGGPTGRTGVVKRPPDVWDWSGGPTLCPRVVGRPHRKSGSSRETLPDVREWSGGPPGCPR